MEGAPFGRYRLVDLLGRGGMGEVWRAHDTVTDRVVALKLLPAQWAEDEVYLQRFRREAHAAARLTEPHVVPIHNYGDFDGRLYVDMRLIDGSRSADAAQHRGADYPRAVVIVEQIAMALDAAHQAGLVHRDVKPSNILIASLRLRVPDRLRGGSRGLARHRPDQLRPSRGHAALHGARTASATAPATSGPTSIPWPACWAQCLTATTAVRRSQPSKRR